MGEPGPARFAFGRAGLDREELTVPKQIVVLGMLANMPVGGEAWLTAHYLLGFERLGYETFYVEAHGRQPTMLMAREDEDPSSIAVESISKTMRRFGFADRWAFYGRYDDERYYGMTERQVKRLYRNAALIVNLHGGTLPLPEHSETDRLVCIDTSPVDAQIELEWEDEDRLELLEPHTAFFTFAENLGNPDCGLPVSEHFTFRPTRQPVVLDQWRPNGKPPGPFLTTVGNWQQEWRDIEYGDEYYTWSKHHEFLKFVDLPALTGQPFELALAGCGDDDRRLLESKGWRVQDALGFTLDPDAYRDYIVESRGEWTVAKDQNVRLRTGWFSDRSASYLAAGRPVITQETGFSNVLPTGEGLFAFSTMDEIVEAVAAVSADYERHSRAAYEIAREFFSHDVVLPDILAAVGL